MPIALSIYEQVQNTRVWFFVKGIFLLFLAALAAFGVFEVVMMMEIFAIFAIASGVITIIMAFINSMDDTRYRNFGLIVGIINLLIGITFLIWPYFFTEVWLIVFVIGLMMDGLFTASALLSIKEMGASKWWSIIGGIAVFLIGIIVVFRVLAFPFAQGQITVDTGMPTLDIAPFAVYLLTAGLFYFVTTAVVNPKNVVKSVVKKETRQEAKAVKKVTRRK